MLGHFGFLGVTVLISANPVSKFKKKIVHLYKKTGGVFLYGLSL